MNRKTVVIRGKASFAKILGEPRLSPNFPEDGKSWSIDLMLDADGVTECKTLGIGDKIKSRATYRDGAPYLAFKQREFKKDGSPNEPIVVKDIKGGLWDQNALIGNDSVVDVRFDIVPTGKKNNLYIKGVRVLDHIPYERKDFEDISEDDPYYAAATAAVASSDTPDFEEDFGVDLRVVEPELDDDMPV